MSRIEQAFSNKKAFIGFLTAGDPSLECSVEYILEMAKAGASIIEIGIPFRDPIAEGKVIQAANIRALQGGINIEGVFEIVQRVRQVSSIPLVFLTYLNPVFHYGYEAFFKRCKEVEVDGIIIPDLPYEEKEEVVNIAKQYDVDVISLIVPTSKKRAIMIAKEATGFICLVSSMRVTEMQKNIAIDLDSIIHDIKEVTNVPIAIGFGINTKEQVSYYSSKGDGVIVDSAIVNIIGQCQTKASQPLYRYVKDIVSTIK